MKDKKRRERIAAAILGGIVASLPPPSGRAVGADERPEWVGDALKWADALIEAVDAE